MNAPIQMESRELGERLKAARSRAGLTQGRAADRLGLARTTLVAIEKGQRPVKAEEIRSLTMLYGVSVNSLLRPSAVHVELVPHFRSLKGANDDAVADATRLLNDLAAAEVELEHMLGKPLSTAYPPERPILAGEVKEQAEEAAMELRHRLGIGLAPVNDMISLLELEIGIRVFVRPLGDGRISGLFAYHDQIGACILINKNHPRERRALTGAHELGHFVSNRRDPDVFIEDGKENSKEERFATAFGLAFLLPAILVRKRFDEFVTDEKHFSPRHLIFMAHALHVSTEAICRRLEDMKLLPRGKWESLKERGFSGEIERQALGDQPQGEASVFPPRILYLAAEAFGRGLVSEGQLAGMLRMNRVEIREMLDLLDSGKYDDAESIPVK